jgi:hypothetical protein
MLTPSDRAKVRQSHSTRIFLVETLIFLILSLIWIAPNNLALIPCQCFIKTCTGDLAKTSTNKAYQERTRDSIWKNDKIYSHYSNELINDDHCDTMNEWNTLIHKK